MTVFQLHRLLDLHAADDDQVVIFQTDNPHDRGFDADGHAVGFEFGALIFRLVPRETRNTHLVKGSA